MSNDSFSDPRFIVSITVIALAAIYDFAISFFHPSADANLIGAILGVLNAGGFAVAIQFWIGSSSGSKEKDVTITHLAAAQHEKNQS